MIEVQDTGIGIAQDVLPRLFEFAERGAIPATRRFGGLGLGLVIARTILEKHGGRLTASSPGHGLGTTFSLEIPLAARSGAAAESNAPLRDLPAQTTPYRPVRILLVEDHQQTRQDLGRLLVSRGHSVYQAGDVATALQIADEQTLDLTICDLELPDGSGIELIAHLRARPLLIPAIALSGFGSPADLASSHAAGFDFHLTKPIDFRHLARVVQQSASLRPEPATSDTPL